MNDEEAIDELIMLRHFLKTEKRYEGQKREVNAISTVLNLIEKQTAEIERQTSLLETEDILLKNEAELSEELKAEIEKKDMIIDKLASFIFNEHYKMTYVDEEQFKERKREIIENTLKIK